MTLNFVGEKNSAKSDSNCDGNDNHYFAFKVSGYLNEPFKSNQDILVDCGCTTHIICDKSKFIEFDKSFEPADHIIELADGSRTKGAVQARGDASINLHDKNGNYHKVILKNALCVPIYKQDIFSVKAATDNGATVIFNPGDATLRAPDGTVFDIKLKGKLYYLNNINSIIKVFTQLKNDARY